MCRLMVFSGRCTRCGEEFVWEDLVQELWCLEAKNTYHFGDCGRGVVEDRHDFDQECDACAEIEGEDEGVADMDGEAEAEGEAADEEEDEEKKKEFDRDKDKDEAAVQDGEAGSAGSGGLEVEPQYFSDTRSKRQRVS